MPETIRKTDGDSLLKRILKILLGLLLAALIVGSVTLGIRNYSILKDVHRYDGEISQAAEKYGIPEHKALIAAIIFTETKGRHTDLMQSSESRYGESGKITDEKDSIDAGVSFLAQALKQAESAGCDEATAIQSYNFGLDYIDYVAERGQKNSKKLAESYSRDVLSPKLGNKEQTKYRYWGLHSLIYNGGFLYHNGGNLFYADIVGWNEMKYKATGFLF